MFTKLEVRAVFWHSHELCIVSNASAEMWQDMNVASINQRYFDKLSTQRLNKWVAEAVLEKWPDLCTPMTIANIADFYRRCQSSRLVASSVHLLIEYLKLGSI